ncbi:hypothetical protein KAI87_04450 [Myxococcota bacterium]|nr:hypothetical protein [Myxococcota bacterium]
MSEEESDINKESSPEESDINKEQSPEESEQTTEGMAEQTTESAPEFEDWGDDTDIKIPMSPAKYGMSLIFPIVVVIALGPSLSRIMDSYRAAVLESREGQLLLAHVEGPPLWLEGVSAEPGDIIGKSAWKWNPEVVEKDENEDKIVLDLYRRYSRTYEGVVTKVILAEERGGAAQAVIKIDGAESFRIWLWTAELSYTQVGMKVIKKSGEWDPVLIRDSIKEKSVDDKTKDETKDDAKDENTKEDAAKKCTDSAAAPQ